MLPNFLIIGAARCGTTSLYHHIRKHPDIFMPANKEPLFFTENGRGMWKLGVHWYENLFVGWNGETAVGEASTGYSKAPILGDVAEKIHRVIPDVRLIYILRDPVAQIVSHYRWIAYHQGAIRSLDTMIMDSDFLVDVASYAFQLKQYLQFFSCDKILVMQFERYIAHPVSCAKQVFSFLDVDNTVSLHCNEALNSSRCWRIKRWPCMQKKLESRLFSRVDPADSNCDKSMLHSSNDWRIKRGSGIHKRLLGSVPGKALRSLLTKQLPGPSISNGAYDRLMRAINDDLDDLKQLADLDYGLWHLTR